MDICFVKNSKLTKFRISAKVAKKKKKKTFIVCTTDKVNLLSNFSGVIKVFL